MNDVEKILEERGATHGNYYDMSRLSQRLKSELMNARRVRSEHGLSPIPHTHLESIELILLKISRIVTGDPNFRGHWDDIEGYAALVAKELKDNNDA